MDMSNRTLAMFLVAAIVVSVAGTFISLNKLSGMETQEVSWTGYATSDTGRINLTIADSVNIDVQSGNDELDYGQCNPGPSGLWVNLGDTTKQGSGAVNCSGDTTSAQTIVVDNIGNVDANVTIAAECTSAQAIGSATAQMNVSSAGCVGGAISTFEIDGSNVRQMICTNVTLSGGADDSFTVTSRAWIPNDATGGTGACADNTNTVTFEAEKNW